MDMLQHTVHIYLDQIARIDDDKYVLVVHLSLFIAMPCLLQTKCLVVIHLLMDLFTMYFWNSNVFHSIIMVLKSQYPTLFRKDFVDVQVLLPEPGIPLSVPVDIWWDNVEELWKLSVSFKCTIELQILYMPWYVRVQI